MPTRYFGMVYYLFVAVLVCFLINLLIADHMEPFFDLWIALKSTFVFGHTKIIAVRPVRPQGMEGCVRRTRLTSLRWLSTGIKLYSTFF